MQRPRFIALVASLTLLSAAAGAGPITFTQVPTVFNNPVGIDYHEPTGQLALSVNYPTGSPLNFELVQPNGTHVPFSTASGFTDEVKIATVRSGNMGGFTTGDLFTGNGVDGQIARISADGSSVSVFADLPGLGNGLMRGSLHVDRTGVFGGDLIAVTTEGQVWRVNSAGGTSPGPLANVETHLEGVLTVPNNPVFGLLAGRIIAGAEGQNLLYAIDSSGDVDSYNVGIPIEDIDFINANENFFGVNFGTGRILTASASDFASLVGGILLTREFPIPGTTGLYSLSWDAMSMSPVVSQLALGAGSATVGQWEHVTFAPFQVNAPEPGSLLLLLGGLAGLMRARRRQR